MSAPPVNCSKQLVLQGPTVPEVQSRTCDGVRTPDYNILYDPSDGVSYVLIDTRKSVGDRMEVVVDGVLQMHETFGFLKIPVVVTLGSGGMTISVTAILTVGGVVKRDTVSISGIMPETDTDADTSHCLRIKKYDNAVQKPADADKSGYVEYYSRTLREAAPQQVTDVDGKSAFWDNGNGRFPFNRVRPCWVNKEGFVEVYFKPDDYTKIASDAGERRINELQRQIEADETVLQRLRVERQAILDSNPTADTEAIDGQIAEWEKLLAEHNDQLSEAKRSSLTSTKIEYIDDPVDRIKCVDGSVMIEFQNIFYTSFEDDDWVYLRISDQRKYCWWQSTHVKTVNGVETEFDTIYISPFYAFDYTRTIDGVVYPYSNPTHIETNYTGDPSTVAKVRGIGSHYEIFDIQNAALMKILQIFRFKSTADIDVATGFTGDMTLMPKLIDVPLFAVKDGKKFAGLDYPFGFGAVAPTIDKSANTSMSWEYTMPISGIAEGSTGTLFVPAVYGAYYGKIGGTAAALTATTNYTDTVSNYASIPAGYKIRDRIPAQFVHEITADSGELSSSPAVGSRKSVGYINSYLSAFGWSKPGNTLLELEDGNSNGSTLPLFVTPVSGSFSETKSVFKSSYGYLSSQIIGGYTREGDTAAYPAWNHTLLNRAVFWKPNELHNIDVRYPQLLYALPQTSGMGNSTGRLTIESYSQGWKQRIYIDDAAYEQNRIRKNVPNADILRWTGVFNLPLGEYLISVQMYNTNDQRSFHSRTGVFLREE